MSERRLTLRGRESISGKALEEAFRRSMTYDTVRDRYSSSGYDLYKSAALAVREWVIDRWFETQWKTYEVDAKRVYYLSLEFLTGRLLQSNILALEAEDEMRAALDSLGIDFDELRALEPDPALGNGGLGRLAACITESAATLSLPFIGYGIRYEYGIFRQSIVDGAQQEAPDPWLQKGNPWEIAREEIRIPVRFRGRIELDRRGSEGHFRWVDTEDVVAVPYDMPILGYGSGAVSTLRLWSARATREFDLERFNAGEYVRAVEEKNATENISRVLYPADDNYVGKELRLKQQYFFVTATLQDILRRFLKRQGRRWEDLPLKAAIQLNDTHPAIAVPELMRILIDDYGLRWGRAWEITEKVFAYTNHTVLPEALESWSIDLMQGLLPRHFQIIEEIDRRARSAASERFPERPDMAERIGIVDRSAGVVRMANLAINGSHSVNGVAELHTQILRDSVFPHFVEMFPGKFNAKTNGVTPRRWLLKANRRLSNLITSRIGDEWITRLELLEQIGPLADDETFRSEWDVVKVANKKRLIDWLLETHGIASPGVDPERWIFDIQIKRIHEYKRQLMNILAVLATWREIREGRTLDVPRLVVFGGKAAPGYVIAKLIIRLIHSVGSLIDRDPVAREMLRVIYVPDYRVSAAERLFPACDLSEQISTAGMEASGTGNMKAALNGAVTIGTLDGANVEIRDRVGDDNIFIFGLDREEIASSVVSGYDPGRFIAESEALREVLAFLESTELEPAQPKLYQPLVDRLRTSDEFFVCADFDAYREAHDNACNAWLDRERWLRMSIANSSSMGYFSSDRTVAEYAREIWNVEALPGLSG